MNPTHSSLLASLVQPCLGPRRWSLLEDTLELPPEAAGPEPGGPGPTQLAAGLALGLFDALCDAVPWAAAYAAECRLGERKLIFDHGAMRTVAGAGRPGGRAAVARLLEPLGYRQLLVYPLERLGMTGYVYTHATLPEALPQYFISELDPQRFSPRFQAIVADLLSSSIDPLPPEAVELLAALARDERLELADASWLLAALLRCFDRHHRLPTLNEYEALREESAEMAWIATEGLTFNHITDRVDDVYAVAARQRALGRPVKDVVEHSASGRVLQTALRAADVERVLRSGDTHIVQRVPGSFLEFISRAPVSAGGPLDLAFDAGNAQGIFKMTDARAV